ncbi:MAG TPA: ABC transporter ATP-binding protein, partial [Clostridia bacterium]|nr:ABC transporter ATP-binding protein [Clostridia bacterium]
MRKKKPAYTLGSNILFSIKVYWRERKSLLFYALLGVAARVSLAFAGVLLPKIVIDEITLGATARHFCGVVGGMAVLFLVLDFLDNYTNIKIDANFGNVGSVIFPIMMVRKLITMDYERMEDPDIKKQFDKARNAVRSNNTLACNLLKIVSLLLVQVLGLILFGSLISSIQPLILVVLVASAAVSWFFMTHARKYEVGTRDERAKLNRKLSYVNESLMNREKAKDIRLYAMMPWLAGVSRALMRTSREAEGRVYTRTLWAQWVSGTMILLRDGGAYAFLIYLLLQGTIDLGRFMMTFLAIGTFAGWISGVLQQSSDLFRASSEMSDYRAYLDLPDRSNTGPGLPLPPLDEAPEILLENVSYTYPGAARPALRDLNLTIRPGERIAVVGVNGAGKTTLIKLICGLYRPQTGRILLAGHDIREYNRDAYFTLLSGVFQDIHLLASSILENISQKTSEETDGDRVWDCAQKAGLTDRIKALPDGLKTPLVRQVNETGIELSGGEKQKLALARALYKNAPVILLDEPTAALDPIAESAVYRQYAELTQG